MAASLQCLLLVARHAKPCGPSSVQSAGQLRRALVTSSCITLLTFIVFFRHSERHKAMLVMVLVRCCFRAPYVALKRTLNTDYNMDREITVLVW
jgi:hypothetical protein